jgi:catechol 2,3-dioxygenase-like lactoylglutathione lyase family enzyme
MFKFALQKEYKMDLGQCYLCLNVANLEASVDFYRRLGFEIIEDHSVENWVHLQHNNLILSLYQEHIENNLINFRGGDIEFIVHEAEKNELRFGQKPTKHQDGSWSAEIKDPDGNIIFFNTFPKEREKYLREGKIN